MREFNIDEVNIGDILPCRDNEHTARVLCTNASGKYPIAALVTGKEYRDFLMQFDKNGVNQWTDDWDNGLDLMLNDFKESIDLYIFRSAITKNLYFSSSKINDDDLVKKVTINI